MRPSPDRRRPALHLLPLLLLSTPALGESEAPAPRVEMQGYGAIRIGMTSDEARKASPGDLEAGEALDDCYYLTDPNQPGVSFMVVAEIVVRIDVRAPGILTDEGLQIGDTEDDVYKIYGASLKLEPHHYVDGHYLTAESADGTHALVFETDGTHVTSIRAGAYPAVGWAESCA